jgi:hypothetical protein
MKTKTILSLALILIAAGLFGMGSQGALYSVAEDLVDEMVAWSKACGGKTDADCSRDLSTLRKTAFKAAEFPAQFAGAPAANDKTPDGENGWIAHWRLYERLFKYHGECFNRYDSQECREKWATFEKEQRRLSSRYGPEPRWAYFPDALKQRVFRPIPTKHIGDKLAKQWGPIPGTAGSAAVASEPSAASNSEAQNKLRTDIETALGKSYRNVPRVWEVQFKDQVVSVRFSIDDNLTAGLIKSSAKSDIKAILKAVQDAGFPYSEINVIGTLDMQDKFGNSQEDEVVRATYLHSTVNKINWAGFLTDNIYAIADSVWLHRAFQ